MMTPERADLLTLGFTPELQKAVLDLLIGEVMASDLHAYCHGCDIRVDVANWLRLYHQDPDDRTPHDPS